MNNTPKNKRTTRQQHTINKNDKEIRILSQINQKMLNSLKVDKNGKIKR